MSTRFLVRDSEKEWDKMLEELQKKVGVRFNDSSILRRAITHSSADRNCNETLEFFGDAILEFIVSERLFFELGGDEGKLTEERSKLVSGSALSKLANYMELEKYIVLGKGEKINNSILADAFEALIAAIYIDQGMEKVKDFIDRTVLGANVSVEENCKGKLQEYAVRHTGGYPEYRIVKEEGPPHNKIFYVEVWIKKELCGKGSGKSVQEAEKNAAKEALHIVT
jgi:ribonuclease-3